MPTVSTVRRPLAVRASVRLIGAETIVKFFQQIIQIRRHCLGHLQFRPKFRADYCSHRIEQRTVFRQQRRGYASRVAMGCPHLFDSPISYPAPHENGVSGAAFPAFALQVRAVATQACWLKKPTRFSFLKSPQVSIAAIAALQPEPCARGGFIRLLMGRRDPHPRTTPMAPPGPASD
jgi:hypothetical protein